MKAKKPKPRLIAIPDYGDHMKLGAFLRRCRDGTFIDYDGFGYYATAEKMTCRVVYPSDVDEGKIQKQWTHVVWFNR